jgi:hypothetical protein
LKDYGRFINQKCFEDLEEGSPSGSFFSSLPLEALNDKLRSAILLAQDLFDASPGSFFNCKYE